MEEGTVNLSCEDNWGQDKYDHHFENHTQGQPIQQVRSSIEGKQDPNEVLQGNMVEGKNRERSSKSFTCEECNKSFSQKNAFNSP